MKVKLGTGIPKVVEKNVCVKGFVLVKNEGITIELSPAEAIAVLGGLGRCNDSNIREHIRHYFTKDYPKELIEMACKLDNYDIYHKIRETLAKTECGTKNLGEIPIRTRIDYFMAVNRPDDYMDEDIRDGIIEDECTGDFFNKECTDCPSGSCSECWTKRLDLDEIDEDMIRED
jgi:hypothetical protein